MLPLFAAMKFTGTTNLDDNRTHHLHLVSGMALVPPTARDHSIFYQYRHTARDHSIFYQYRHTARDHSIFTSTYITLHVHVCTCTYVGTSTDRHILFESVELQNVLVPLADHNPTLSSGVNLWLFCFCAGKGEG